MGENDDCGCLAMIRYRMTHFWSTSTVILGAVANGNWRIGAMSLHLLNVKVQF